jgi:hypothetical protein
MQRAIVFLTDIVFLNKISIYSRIVVPFLYTMGVNVSSFLNLEPEESEDASIPATNQRFLQDHSAKEDVCFVHTIHDKFVYDHQHLSECISTSNNALATEYTESVNEVHYDKERLLEYSKPEEYRFPPVSIYDVLPFATSEHANAIDIYRAHFPPLYEDHFLKPKYIQWIDSIMSMCRDRHFTVDMVNEILQHRYTKQILTHGVKGDGVPLPLLARIDEYRHLVWTTYEASLETQQLNRSTPIGYIHGDIQLKYSVGEQFQGPMLSDPYQFTQYWFIHHPSSIRCMSNLPYSKKDIRVLVVDNPHWEPDKRIHHTHVLLYWYYDEFEQQWVTGSFHFIWKDSMYCFTTIDKELSTASRTLLRAHTTKHLDEVLLVCIPPYMFPYIHTCLRIAG